MPAVDTVSHANLLNKRKTNGGKVTTKKATVTTQKKTVSEPNEEVTAKKAKVTTKNKKVSEPNEEVTPKKAKVSPTAANVLESAEKESRQAAKVLKSAEKESPKAAEVLDFAEEEFPNSTSPPHPNIVEWAECPELAALSVCLCSQPQHTQVHVREKKERGKDIWFVFSRSERVCQTTKSSEHAELLRQLHMYGVEKAELEHVKRSHAFIHAALPTLNVD